MVSEKAVTNVHKSLDKYRVTMKVLLGMLSDFDPRYIVSYEQIDTSGYEVHQIALHQLYMVVKEVREAMQNYEFHKALAAINEWVARDLSASYLESVKDHIYCGGRDDLNRQMSQTVLYHIFSQFQHMLGPITPLLVEETYEFTPEAVKKVAGHPLQRVWLPTPTEWENEVLAPQIGNIMAINSAVNAAQEEARADKLMGQSLACEVLIGVSPDHPVLGLRTQFWEDFLVVSNARWSTDQNIALQAIEEFSKAHTEQERETVRAACAIQFDALREEHIGPQKDKPTWTRCREVEDPARKGGIMACVYVMNPTEEKCARCWRYAADESDKQDVPPLCTRCADVMRDS